ncbi:hypothetical protein [Mariniblastus fucicola]|nr:hypothetical protein [Mariniblastus fucicola]
MSKQSTTDQTSPKWMKWMLIAAGIYNLAFGVFAILFPSAMFRLIEMQQPKYLELWQCIGMIVGVYGVGYIIAAFDPVRHWPIVLVGLLGKLFGPIGMAWAVFRGTLPLEFGIANVTNDLVWLVPFAIVLVHARRSQLSRDR